MQELLGKVCCKAVKIFTQDIYIFFLCGFDMDYIFILPACTAIMTSQERVWKWFFLVGEYVCFNHLITCDV